MNTCQLETNEHADCFKEIEEFYLDMNLVT